MTPMSNKHDQRRDKTWPAESGKNDSGWSTPTESGTHNDGQQAGTRRKRGVFRKVGRATAKLTALDVLLRDGKRIRSRFPNLWADIFSRVRQGEASEPSATTNHSKLRWLTPALTGTITVCLALYTWAFALARNPESTVEAWSLLACGAVTLAGAFQTACFSYTAWLQATRNKKASSNE